MLRTHTHTHTHREISAVLLTRETAVFVGASRQPLFPPTPQHNTTTDTAVLANEWNPSFAHVTRTNE
jgi:hypothetical protein